MGYRFATTQDREAIVALVVDAAEAVSLRLTPFELASSPAAFRRSDATSVFRPKNSTIYSSHQLLDAEDRLLERSHDTTGPTVSLRTMERIARRPDSDGRVLGEDQSDALVRIAVSGRVLDVLVGPAGAGKTTAMNALRRAWETEHGAGSVVGLAPSAGAAQVLAEDLGIATENTAKWWQSHQTTGATFNAGQLVIVDEASLAGTLSLDRITRLAAEEGAKVLLVGDHAQLQAVDAGGSFGLLVHDRGDAPELVDVHRFTHAWEKTASLDLRHGRTDVIDSYDAHGRIHDGETEEMIDSAYTSWRADLLAGKSTVLVSDSNESVTALNTRARTDLILDGAVRGPREVDLHDGTRAATGDVVITRRNDRRLRAGRGWVRNGDRWNAMDVRDDGSMALQRAGAKWGATVIVPADYVAEHVELGYAVTSYRAQGITTDTAHVLVDSAMTRENLYVAMTRGRDANIAYVAVDQPDTAHDIPHPGDNQASTGRSVLYGVLQHAGAELSAHETIAAEQETWGSIAQLAAEYETIAAAAQHDRWATLIQNSGLTETQAADVLASDAFGPLTAELRRAEANHHDVDALLPKLVRARRLDNADDVAAVVHHRVAMATARPAGSGRTRKTPRLIAGLIPEATGSMSDEMRQALNERRDLIEARADAVLDNALAEAAPWTAELGPRPTNVEKLATWRHSARVVAAYRDRYQIITEAAIGTQAETIGQKIDAARAQAALDAVRRLAASSMPMEKVQTAAPSSGRFL
jgi:energy-coupling factor transporter ATP-binding protein EcfA2